MMSSNNIRFRAVGRTAQFILIALLTVFFVGGSLRSVPAQHSSVRLASDQAFTGTLNAPSSLSAIPALSNTFVPASTNLFQELYCASDNGRRNYCNTDTRRGVRMVRQRSDAACIQGRTWGFDRRGIWVDRGCRADFAIGNRDEGRDRGGRENERGGREGDRGGNVQTFYCESGDGRRHWCKEGIGGSVSLVKQRSEAACIEGRTWGRDRSGVWVDRGCRADFEVRR